VSPYTGRPPTGMSCTERSGRSGRRARRAAVSAPARVLQACLRAGGARPRASGSGARRDRPRWSASGKPAVGCPRTSARRHDRGSQSGRAARPPARRPRRLARAVRSRRPPAPSARCARAETPAAAKAAAPRPLWLTHARCRARRHAVRVRVSASCLAPPHLWHLKYRTFFFPFSWIEFARCLTHLR
jgi:hypothetical protein